MCWKKKDNLNFKGNWSDLFCIYYSNKITYKAETIKEVNKLKNFPYSAAKKNFNEKFSWNVESRGPQIYIKIHWYFSSMLKKIKIL